MLAWVGKILTGTVFVLVAGATTLAVAGPGLGLWRAGAAGLPGAVVLGLLAGVVAASLHWLVLGGSIEAELRRIKSFLNAGRSAERPIGQGDGESPTGSLFWFRQLGQSIQQVLDTSRRQLDQMHHRVRELEIERRIADAQRQHAETILQSISDAVMVTDAFNEVQLFNDAAAEALRFDPHEARQMPVDRLIHDGTLIKLIKDTREAGNLANRRRIELALGRNGRQAVYEVTLGCVADARKEVLGVVTVLRDVTHEKEVSEMKSDFVSRVSHELRTPLSSIQAYIEMLMDGEAADERARGEFYSIIQTETSRLSRLIDNMLNISRIESGVIKVQREQVAVSKLTREIVEMLQPQARAGQITLVDQSVPLTGQIYADKDMIYQALLNLVGNAVKYTPEGGRVAVTTDVEEPQRQITVAVSDTGVGIPPHALPHVFEKFYRVGEHKKLAKGTGLGLNLVKHIVETVHDGSVEVASEMGAGSTFTVKLPISDGAG